MRPDAGRPAGTSHRPTTDDADGPNGSAPAHAASLSPPLEALCAHTPPGAQQSVTRALGVCLADAAPTRRAARTTGARPDDDALIAMLAACMRAIGRRPSGPIYDRWREHVLAEADRTGVRELEIAAPSTITRHFDSWPAACALGVAFAPDLLPPVPVDTGPSGPRARLAELDDALLRSIGLSVGAIGELHRAGPLALGVPDAVALAAHLDASVSWLAGRQSHPGRPADPERSACDPALVLDHTRGLGITDTRLRGLLGLAPGPWRRITEGRECPTFGLAVRLAGIADLAPTAVLVRAR